MKKGFSTFIAVLAFASFLLCVPGINNSFAIQAISEVPEEVAIGTEINVEMIDIEYHGEIKKASSLVVHTPTGTIINSTKIYFSEAGKYVFDFSAMFGSEKITKSVEVMSIRTPVSMFSGYHTNISYGSFAYNDRLDPSLEIEDYKGVKVNPQDGGTVTFNKVLNFNNVTKDTSFIDFIVEPSTPGSYDIGEIIITLTDADDESNKVDIRYVDGLAGSGDQTRLTYATARATGQYYAGYENWNGLWHINSDQTGAPTFLTLRGLGDTPIGYLNSQLFFDYPSKSIYVEPEYSVFNSKVLINDLDNTSVYPTNPWSGFKNGRAILSITAKDVVGNNARYVIKSIMGYDFTNRLLKDITAPKLSIDYDGGIKESLPFAKLNCSYPIYEADVFDDFDDDLIFDKKVQFINNNAYIDVSHDGKRFTTNYYGDYLISYYCSDRSGNKVEDSYIVHCSPNAIDMVIIVPEDSNTYRAFDNVELCSLSDVEVKNAQGRVTLSRYLITPEDEIVELKKDYFVPTKPGLYKVKYVVADVCDEPVTKTIEYNIQNINNPIIVDYINLPKVMIKGQYYDIPNVVSKCPSGSEIVDGDVNVYVNDVLFEGNKLYVDSLSDYHIDFVPETNTSGKKSFLINVVEGTDASEKTIKENYFYSEDSNYLVEHIRNKSMQFLVNSESYIHFIKSVSSSELSLSFALDSDTIQNYENLNIKIQDKNSPDRSVTLQVASNGTSLKLFTPHEILPKDLDCDSEKQFELYYRAFTKSLRDRNYKDICNINYYDDGEVFNGFSDEVYISFGLSNLANPANVSLVFINNQSFKTSIVKDNAGPQIITDNNLNWTNELGAEITIPQAKAFDVLSYVNSLQLTVIDPDNNVIINNDDATIEHKITLSKYGSYRIYYSSKDGNGRNSNRSFTICCIENEDPQLTVNFTPKSEYSVGSSFVLPSYSFTDNSLNCTLDVLLYLPSGQGIAIEHADMVDGEITTSNYLDLDHYSSDLVKSNNSFKFYAAGKYTLRYIVVDAYGNIALKEFTLNAR
jgi:hypothetical protein